MTLNSVNFDIKESSFSDEKNNIKDGKGMGRDGSGRAAIYRETALKHCFTLEANYSTGVRINPLKPRFDLINKVKLIKEDSQVQDANSAIYKGKKTPIFTPEIFKDIGKSFLISILDYENVNPMTRLVKNESETIDAALDKLRQELQRDVDRIKHSNFKKANAFKPNFEIIMVEKNDIDQNNDDNALIEMVVKEEKHKCNDDFDLKDEFQISLKDHIDKDSVGGNSDLVIVDHIRSLSMVDGD